MIFNWGNGNKKEVRIDVCIKGLRHNNKRPISVELTYAELAYLLSNKDTIGMNVLLALFPNREQRNET